MQLMEQMFSYWESGENPYLLPTTDGDESKSYSIRALTFQVLSDATNQDKLRSCLRIFAPARAWMGQVVKDLQGNTTASVKHCLALATGARVQHLVRETITSATSWATLEAINASNPSLDAGAQETMQMHVTLTCSWLGSMYELSDHFKCFPWKSILACHERRFVQLLEAMRVEVAFVRRLDDLNRRGDLYKKMSFTRWQTFRELLVEAESIKYDADHPDAAHVREIFLSCSGLSLNNVEASTLCSLACELTFNDLRDAERRSQKQEIRTPPAVACSAIKSSWGRSPLEKIELQARDWSDKETPRLLKASVLANHRQNDRDLGVPMSELTNQQFCAHITKPHILQQRLRLYCVLLAEFEADREIDLEQLCSRSWPCRMLCPCTLWRLSEQDDAETRLVLQAGPHTVRYAVVENVLHNDTIHYRLSACRTHIQETLRFDGVTGQLSLAVGVASEQHGLLLQAEAWLPPVRYLLSHSILKVPAGFIVQFCQLHGLGGGKATHRDRVQRLLEHENYPQEYIDEILEQLPEPRPRRARAAADGRDATQTMIFP
ncbi:unnamed protein product [Symbiodinium sp. CCMP2592]|nr:unnamed protein product [Symbiodinium sp. CCMP2592]